MLEHVVLFKVRSGTASDLLARMADGIRGLKEYVPVVVDLTFGANVTDRGQGFTHGLVVRLNSREDLDLYLEHPEHVRVVSEDVRPIVEDVLAVDYEW
jgi:hypothetical protein